MAIIGVPRFQAKTLIEVPVKAPLVLRALYIVCRPSVTISLLPKRTSSRIHTSQVRVKVTNLKTPSRGPKILAGKIKTWSFSPTGSTIGLCRTITLQHSMSDIRYMSAPQCKIYLKPIARFLFHSVTAFPTTTLAQFMNGHPLMNHHLPITAHRNSHLLTPLLI